MRFFVVAAAAGRVEGPGVGVGEDVPSRSEGSTSICPIPPSVMVYRPLAKTDRS